jgi:uncharacterized protein YjiS (DUF1127 family)
MSCANKACYSENAFRTPMPVWMDWPWPDWLRALPRAYRQMRERSLQRQALMELDNRLLADIGLTRADAVCEAGKWPWQGVATEAVVASTPARIRAHAARSYASGNSGPQVPTVNYSALSPRVRGSAEEARLLHARPLEVRDIRSARRGDGCSHLG